MKNIKVGVIGAGAMGKNPVRVYSMLKGVELVGIYDKNPDHLDFMGDTYGTEVFGNMHSLLKEVDAVTVATPTITHHEIGQLCLQQGVHTLMEKPIAIDSESGGRLCEMAEKSKVILAVGHIEQYNPAVIEVEKILEGQEILSLEAKRLGPFHTRGTDVDVMLDLMVHDLDLALKFIGKEPIYFSGLGNGVFSDNFDIANVQIGFEGGAIVSLWASKATEKKVRTLSINTKNNYIELDYIDKSIAIHRLSEISPACRSGYKIESQVERVYVQNQEPLVNECSDFIECIRTARMPLVDGWRATRCLKIIEQIRSQTATPRPQTTNS